MNLLKSVKLWLPDVRRHANLLCDLSIWARLFGDRNLKTRLTEISKSLHEANASHS